MANEEKRVDPIEGAERREKIANQVESVIREILRGHPQLAAIRSAMRRDEEPSDKFAREFLRVFKQRLQG